MAPYARLYHRCRPDIARFGGLPLWLLLRCLPTVIAVSLLLLLASVPARAGADQGALGNPALDSPALEDLASGHMLLRGGADDSYLPALVQGSKVHFDIAGMVATVRLEQTFRNDSVHYVEGIYAFPLPEDAAVRHMEMAIGERRIVGRIRERAEAQRIYQAARTSGKKASLVEQQRANLFTNRVANIGPGQEVTVRLEYVQAVAYDGSAFSLRFPMTITPRYMPGKPLPTEDRQLTLDPAVGWVLPTDQVPDADAISPWQHRAPGSDLAPLNPIAISASLDMGMPLASVTSPYHDIALSRRAGVYSVSLAGGVSEMNRDFVLTWQPLTGAAPRAALFTERVGEDYFGLLMVLPPTAQRHDAGIAREIVFVIDTSGSMSGVSIEQARAALSRALERLQPGDRFNIIEFNSGHRALYRTAMPATSHHVQQAREFVRLLRAAGGTEMLPALRRALQSPEPDLLQDQQLLRQVIFITDGAVGNEQALFTELTALLGDSRLFTVGIGSAPNSWFMRKAAEFGRGSHTYIGDLNEVGEKMTALFEQLSRPAAVGLAVDWPLSVEAWPAQVPDLYHGQPLSLAVSFGSTLPVGEVTVRGTINGRPWRQRLQLDGAGAGAGQGTAGDGHAGIASVWARRKIGGLLEQLVLGTPESEVRAAVLPLALAHRLLSPYTSFVAVEERIARPAGEALDTEPLANTRPRGQGDQPFAYPHTATTGPARAWFGLLALFLALLLRTVRLPEVDSDDRPPAKP